VVADILGGIAVILPLEGAAFAFARNVQDVRAPKRQGTE
jgi:hypothetical protein